MMVFLNISDFYFQLPPYIDNQPVFAIIREKQARGAVVCIGSDSKIYKRQL